MALDMHLTLMMLCVVLNWQGTKLLGEVTVKVATPSLKLGAQDGPVRISFRCRSRLLSTAFCQFDLHLNLSISTRVPVHEVLHNLAKIADTEVMCHGFGDARCAPRVVMFPPHVTTFRAKI